MNWQIYMYNQHIISKYVVKNIRKSVQTILVYKSFYITNLFDVYSIYLKNTSSSNISIDSNFYTLFED